MTNDEKQRMRATAWGIPRIILFLFVVALSFGLGLKFGFSNRLIGALHMAIAAAYAVIAYRIDRRSTQHGTIYQLENASALAVFVRGLIILVK